MINKIEDYQREVIKQRQTLPTNTSNPASYLLLGILPVQGEIDKRILTTFNRIANDTSSAEYDIINRQVAIKDLNSHSWTTSVKKITFKYDLPSVYRLLENPYKKDEWNI